jgi:hypothetical protein
LSQARLNDSTADTIREHYQALFASAFIPQIRYEQMPGSEERIAYAAEFAAYRLGQIDDKLARLIEIMERGAEQASAVRK